MKYFFIIISFIFSQLLIAQECDSIQSIIDSVWVLKKGYVKDYYEKQYYKNGEIERRGYRIKINESDQVYLLYKFGKWEYFYKNGKLYEVEYFDLEGNMCDTTKKYFPNGHLYEEIIWGNDTTYSLNRNNSYRLIRSYCLKKYRNEKLYKIMYFKAVDGGLIKTGKWIWYNKDGSIKKSKLYL